MKIKRALILALLAAGSAFGAAVQAQSVNYSMHYCCSALQEECYFVHGEDSPRCAGVYERCMLSRYCIIP
jgi:hypothetical protein